MSAAAARPEHDYSYSSGDDYWLAIDTKTALRHPAIAVASLSAAAAYVMTPARSILSNEKKSGASGREESLPRKPEQCAGGKNHF